MVRVDARRLRDKLREYDDARLDPVVISLPKGTYVPVFEQSSVAAVALPPAADLAGPRERLPGTRLSRKRVVVGALVLVAVVLTALAAWRARRVQTGGPGQLLPLASYSGAEGPPAIPPNGDLVAFAWSGQAEPGQTDIYVKAIDSEAFRRLTETPDSETSPAWSPDGQSIAFVRDRRGVFTMSQLGGAERQVSASGNQVAWAGDSKSVLIRDRKGKPGPLAFTRYSSRHWSVAW